jgi:signal transduction histidine kinase
MGDDETNELRFELEASELEKALSRQILRDIQAPLEAISNLSYLAAHRLGEPGTARSYLKALDDQVERIAARLRDYLHCSKDHDRD